MHSRIYHPHSNGSNPNSGSPIGISYSRLTSIVRILWRFPAADTGPCRLIQIQIGGSFHDCVEYLILAPLGRSPHFPPPVHLAWPVFPLDAWVPHMACGSSSTALDRRSAIWESSASPIPNSSHKRGEARQLPLASFLPALPTSPPLAACSIT